jgi:hypothetical protein
VKYGQGEIDADLNAQLKRIAHAILPVSQGDHQQAPSVDTGEPSSPADTDQTASRQPSEDPEPPSDETNREVADDR